LGFCETLIEELVAEDTAEFAVVDKVARSKTRVWKIRHHVAGMDFAGVHKSALITGTLFL